MLSSSIPQFLNSYMFLLKINVYSGVTFDAEQ